MVANRCYSPLKKNLYVAHRYVRKPSLARRVSARVSTLWCSHSFSYATLRRRSSIRQPRRVRTARDQLRSHGEGRKDDRSVRLQSTNATYMLSVAALVVRISQRCWNWRRIEFLGSEEDPQTDPYSERCWLVLSSLSTLGALRTAWFRDMVG